MRLKDSKTLMNFINFMVAAGALLIAVVLVIAWAGASSLLVNSLDTWATNTSLSIMMFAGGTIAVVTLVNVMLCVGKGLVSWIFAHVAASAMADACRSQAEDLGQCYGDGECGCGESCKCKGGDFSEEREETDKGAETADQ